MTSFSEWRMISVSELKLVASTVKDRAVIKLKEKSRVKWNFVTEEAAAVQELSRVPRKYRLTALQSAGAL